MPRPSNTNFSAGNVSSNTFSPDKIDLNSAKSNPERAEVLRKSSALTVLGIDPGTGIVGFGVISQIKGNSKLLDGGVIRTPAHQADELRLLTIYNSISEIIAQHNPDVMAVEKLFFARNVTTAMSVSQARGVILLAATIKGIPIAEYTPLQIKQALTGYGRADKNQIQEMVKIMLRLTQIPKPDDCADALAAALTHVQTLHIPPKVLQ